MVSEPERSDASPPVTEISPESNPVTDFEKVAVTVNGAFVGFGAEVSSVTDGRVVVIIHENDAGVSSVLPAASFALTWNVCKSSVMLE